MGHSHRDKKVLPLCEPLPDHELVERITRLEEKVGNIEKQVEEWVKFLREITQKLLVVAIPIAFTIAAQSILTYLRRFGR